MRYFKIRGWRFLQLPTLLWAAKKKQLWPSCLAKFEPQCRPGVWLAKSAICISHQSAIFGASHKTHTVGEMKAGSATELRDLPTEKLCCLASLYASPCTWWGCYLHTCEWKAYVRTTTPRIWGKFSNIRFQEPGTRNQEQGKWMTRSTFSASDKSCFLFSLYHHPP